MTTVRVDTYVFMQASPGLVVDRLMYASRLRAAEDLAVDHTQGKVTEAELGIRLHELAPRLSPYEQQHRFEQLVEAIQYRQDVHDGMVTPAEVEPRLAHPEVLADHAAKRVDAALHDLIGGGL